MRRSPSTRTRVARSLTGAQIVTSFLGAHAIPPEYKGRPDAYLNEQALPALRAAHAELERRVIERTTELEEANEQLVAQLE